MPTLRESVQLCIHTMNNASSLPTGWRLMVTSAQHQLEGGTLGYHGVAYIHEGTATDPRQEVVVVHRGTKLKRIEDKETVLKASGDGICNLANDGSIAFQRIPIDTEKALAFAKVITNEYSEKPAYRLLQLGHSLGGVHAHVCGYVLEQPVIALDVPGIGEALHQAISTKQLTEKPEQLNQHYTFLSQPNIVNSIHTQIGNVHQRIVAITDNASKDLLKATPKKHKLSSLLDFITDDLPDPTVARSEFYEGFVLLNRADRSPKETLSVERGRHVYNVFGGHYFIHEEQGVLSLVRKFNAAHAFLVLESIMHSQRHLLEIHLVIKNGTENTPIPKADILFRNISVDRLKALAAGCHHASWAVTPEQMRALELIVVAEMSRSHRNEIDYFLAGNAPAAGFFGASLQQSKSEALREWSVQNKKSSVSDYLLGSGHNCYSWAKAVVQALGLNPPTSFVEAFIKDPRLTIGEEEPNTTCSLL